MSKHTPGPWRSSGLTVQRYRSGSDSLTPRWMSLPKTEANARLIASAPDLLEALKAVVENFAPLSEKEEAAYRKGFAAIAKAEGKS